MIDSPSRGQNSKHLYLYVDRAPNLGGLSRTCEIFGAGKLVLNNKKIIEDKDFLNTSVTAHQWIDIIEFKIEDLKTYLEQMKLQQGYQIIGIGKSRVKNR